jgi:hypothetical protein
MISSDRQQFDPMSQVPLPDLTGIGIIPALRPHVMLSNGLFRAQANQPRYGMSCKRNAVIVTQECLFA